MHTDGNSVSNNARLDFDICIVGAGAAGIVLALEVSAKKPSLRVALLESGSFEPDPTTQQLYKGTVDKSGLPHDPLDIWRQRYFGGSTNCWGAGCLPFDPIDFRKRDYVPNSGWPIQYSDLIPFYQDAVLYCDIDKFDFENFTADPSERALVDRLATNPNIVTKIWRRTAHGASPNFGQLYKDRLIKSKTVSLITNSNLTDLAKEGDSVKQLEFKTLKGNRFFVSAGKFVLATGGLETARLLLVANRKYHNTLGNQDDCVGRFYSPHVNVNQGVLIMRPGVIVRPDYESTPDQKATFRRFWAPSEQAMLRHRLLNFKITLDARNPEQLDPIDLAMYSLINPEFNAEDVSRYRYYSLNGDFAQIPNRESRVTLTNEIDALGMPTLKLKHVITDQDMKSYLDSYKLIENVLGTFNVGRLKYDRSGQFILKNSVGKSHHMGTTRMAHSEREGVVDSNCKVFGTKNLFIASASTFSTPSQANPTFTIIALAIRLARLLSQGEA